MSDKVRQTCVHQEQQMNPTDSSPPSYHSVDGKRQDIKNGEKAGNISTKSTSGWRTTLNREIFHRCDSVARSLAEQKRKAAMKQLLKSGFDITIKSFDQRLQLPILTYACLCLPNPFLCLFAKFEAIPILCLFDP
jgi:hypothetical protein